MADTHPSDALSYDKAADILIALIQSSGYPTRLKELVDAWSEFQERAPSPFETDRLSRDVSQAASDALAIDALLFRQFLDSLVGNPETNLHDSREGFENVLTKLRSRQ